MRHQPAIEFTTAPLNTNVRIPLWLLLIIFLAYALPGAIGHAPWRGDDVLNIATTASMLHSGNWLVPHVAGDPVLNAPLVHHWLGAIFGTLLGWLLPLHDAIRLASLTALAFGIWALRDTARRMLPQHSTAMAVPLLILSTLGLLIQAHEAQPMITLLALIAGSLWGLSMLDTAARRGFLIAGGFCAAAFLDSGLAGLVLTLPACVTRVLLIDQRKRQETFANLLPGALLFVGLSLALPCLLAISSPDALSGWWHQALMDVTPHAERGRLSALIGLLSWYVWPLWPIALYAIWHRRKQLRQPFYASCVAALLGALWIVSTTGPVRAANALPLIPTLALLAASEAGRLRKGAGNALDWFAIMTFSLLGLFLWLAWSALHLGWPVAMARNVMRLAPGFTPHIGWWAVPVAVLLSVIWIITLIRLPHFALRSALRWTLGITLAWGLATTLWLDWFDYDRNYSRITAQISGQLTEHKLGCVMSLGAGDVQRAALEYFANIRLQRFVDATQATPKTPHVACDAVLSYASGRNSLQEPGAGWTQIWSLQKGRGRAQEQFALFTRANPAAIFNPPPTQ